MSIIHTWLIRVPSYHVGIKYLILPVGYSLVDISFHGVSMATSVQGIFSTQGRLARPTLSH